MTCCGTATLAGDGALSGTLAAGQEIRLGSRSLKNGSAQITLSVPDIHCGACMHTVEDALNALPFVSHARANLTVRSATITWDETATDADLAQIVPALESRGYAAHLETLSIDDADPELKRLIRSLAVAGMAAMNIMLLSVSVWSGAEGATRDMFHWISAIIAGPAIAYAGMPFFKPALLALRHGRTNMDVPISLAIILAFSMSLYEVSRSAEHAWFDAPVMLLFFLLIGRTLDHLTRARAARDVKSLQSMMAKGALVVQPDGTHTYLPIDQIKPNMILQISAGERFPVDGIVTDGASIIDRSIVNGEAHPINASKGMEIEAGILNLSGPILMRCTSDTAHSFIAQMQSMIDTASEGRGKYRKIADRAARLYAPVVHLTALATFIGWVLITGDWHRAMYAAVSTLIITCPCALALAVPMVHAVAAGKLSKAGILVKDGAALEQLANVSTVIFDKTGTLTNPETNLSRSDFVSDTAKNMAATLAQKSTHPYSRGIVSSLAYSADSPIQLNTITEHQGYGVEAYDTNGNLWRLGAPLWCIENGTETAGENLPAVALSCNGEEQASFWFDEQIRPGTQICIDQLKTLLIRPIIASGDHALRVAKLAQSLGIDEMHGAMKPHEKLALIEQIKQTETVLMVGDGMNDAPALSAANVSMAPARASEIGRSASGIVFLHNDLASVSNILIMAKRVRKLVFQNFGIAIVYNFIFVPIAVLGLASPLVAALAMSLSSIAVVANAMRVLIPDHWSLRKSMTKKRSPHAMIAQNKVREITP